MILNSSCDNVADKAGDNSGNNVGDNFEQKSPLRETLVQTQHWVRQARTVLKST